MGERGTEEQRVRLIGSWPRKVWQLGKETSYGLKFPSLKGLVNSGVPDLEESKC